MPCELDSDSDEEEDAGGTEPPAKRPREIYALTTGSPGAWSCPGSDSLPECRSAAPQSELQQLLASSEVKRILGELDKLADLKVPAGRIKKVQPAASQWTSDCAEVYSAPRITAAASRMGLKPAWAMDLTTVDDEGKPWDFSRADQRRKALRKLKEDKPLMLVACPMCGPFSTINELNYANMKESEIRKKLHEAMLHMKFALTLCLQQYLAGRLFMFEHPAGASSWSTKMMTDMLSREGVFLAKFDFCQLGMVASKGSGGKGSAKKRTAVMTNSKHVAETLRLAQCDKSHSHVQLVGGKAKQCEVYPEKFAQLICESIKREISDSKWRGQVAEKFEIGPTVEKLMSIQAKMELVEPPHEAEGTTCLRDLYEGQEFVDDVSGLPLDKELAIKARMVEIGFFRERGVYTKVRREPWMRVITTKWLDVNKGDLEKPNYRARLVGREVAYEKRDDFTLQLRLWRACGHCCPCAPASRR